MASVDGKLRDVGPTEAAAVVVSTAAVPRVRAYVSLYNLRDNRGPVTMATAASSGGGSGSGYEPGRRAGVR